MRDYNKLATNKAVSNCAYFRTEIKDSFRKRHIQPMLDSEMGRGIVKHNIREYKVWYEILIRL